LNYGCTDSQSVEPCPNTDPPVTQHWAPLCAFYYSPPPSPPSPPVPSTAGDALPMVEVQQQTQYELGDTTLEQFCPAAPQIAQQEVAASSPSTSFIVDDVECIASGDSSTSRRRLSGLSAIIKYNVKFYSSNAAEATAAASSFNTFTDSDAFLNNGVKVNGQTFDIIGSETAVGSISTIYLEPPSAPPLPPSPPPPPPSSSGLGVGAIVGIVIGVLAVIGLIIALVICMKRSQKVEPKY